MRDIHCPKDIGFENTFSGEDCEKEQHYNNCYHCWSTALVKGKIHCVLDKIRAEIEVLPKTYPFVNHFDMYVKEDDVRQIIDKYKAESEEV